MVTAKKEKVFRIFYLRFNSRIFWYTFTVPCRLEEGKLTRVIACRDRHSHQEINSLIRVGNRHIQIV